MAAVAPQITSGPRSKNEMGQDISPIPHRSSQNTPGFKWVGQRELSQILTPAQIRTLLLIGDFPAGVPLFDGRTRRSAMIIADKHPSILQRDFWADGTPWFVLMPEIAERLGKPAPLPGLAHATSMSGVLL